MLFIRNVEKYKTEINTLIERVKFTFLILELQKVIQSDQCEAKFNTIPIIIKEDTRNDPPADKNGKGSPLTGIRPTVIAELTNICAKNIVATPTKLILVNLSRVINANCIILKIRKAYNKKMKRIMIKPNSSPMTDKIKSDS